VNTAPTFRYETTLGCWGRIAHPVDVKVNENKGWTYVLNRSTAWHAPHGRAVGVVVLDENEDVVHDFGRLGTDPGQLFMPTALAIGPDDRVYVSDEHLQSVTVFGEDGTFIERWGTKGSEPGELNGPAGLAFDSKGHLFVTDHGNARVQCFTPSGEFLATFGSAGRGPGELQRPWGLAIDSEDRVWVADWENDRVQCFLPDGRCHMVLGGTAGDGASFRRPASLAIDRRGIVFVADWGNDRVLVFDKDSNHIGTWHGDSSLSKWALQRLEEFPVFQEQRQAAGTLRSRTPLLASNRNNGAGDRADPRGRFMSASDPDLPDAG
jgi:sugar lactone lactonase YvrE